MASEDELERVRFRGGMEEDSDEDENNLGEEEWSDEDESCTDLLGTEVLPNPRACIDKLKAVHGLDVGKELKIKDEYEWIRLVNFCRQAMASGKAVVETVAGVRQKEYLNDDKYLQPVDPQDPLLYSFEECVELENEADDGGVSPEERIKLLEADLVLCKAKIHELLEDANSESSGSSMSEDEDENTLEKAKTTLKLAKRSKSKKDKVFNDNYYFESYGHLDIHEEMLRDKPRTESYRDGLEFVLRTRSGASVMDVGCGTGILCLFAARSGAGSVIGIEASKIGELAERIIQRNNFSDIIRVERSKVESLEISDKVDIIVSEWMGYGLLFESMLDSVLIARDQYLKPDGILVPCRASIFVQGQNDSARFNFWKNVYGFDFSDVVIQLERKEAVVEVVPASTIVTSRALAFEIDIKTVTKEQLDFKSSCTITASAATELTSIVISFDCLMAEGSDLVLSTAVESPETHWAHTILPLRAPLSLAAGQSTTVHLTYKRNQSNPREIDITLALEDGIPILYNLK